MQLPWVPLNPASQAGFAKQWADILGPACLSVPRFIKKLEHTWKALVHDGVSVIIHCTRWPLAEQLRLSRFCPARGGQACHLSRPRWAARQLPHSSVLDSGLLAMSAWKGFIM